MVFTYYCMVTTTGTFNHSPPTHAQGESKMAYTEIVGITSVLGDTAANWAASDLPVENNVLILETDTLKMKVGNNVDIYADLDYVVDEVFTTAFKTLLANAGNADGVLVLDSEGLIPLAKIPTVAQVKPEILANIAARDAILAENRNTIYIVLDASGDATVTAGSATYIWNATDEEWIKISEFESLDLDLSGYVTKGSTLADLTDGGGFVRMTDAERSKLAIAVTTEDEIFLMSPANPASTLYTDTQ